MSPLIHRSLTWTIVGTVVSMSTWLAGNVQQQHDRQGTRFGAAPQRWVSTAPAMPAARPHAQAVAPAGVVATPDTQAAVRLATTR